MNLNITETAIDNAFRETLEELSNNPMIEGIMDIISQKYIERFNTIPESDRIYCILAMGYAIEKIVKNQVLLDVTQEKMHDKMDGYEILGKDGEKSIIFTGKNQCKTKKEVLELIEKTTVLKGVKEEHIRKLSEFEICKYKKDVKELCKR